MCDRIPISGLDVPASPLRRLQLKQNADVFVHVCVHVLLMLNVGYSAGPDTSCLINHFLSHQVTAGFLCSHVILALKMASNMFNFLFFFFLLFLQGSAVLSHVSSFMTSINVHLSFLY